MRHWRASSPRRPLGRQFDRDGLLTAEQTRHGQSIPRRRPASLEETGISSRNLLYLLLKFMLVEAAETLLDLAER